LDNLRDDQRIKQDVAVVLDENYFVNHWTVHEVEQVLKLLFVSNDDLGDNRYRVGIASAADLLSAVLPDPSKKRALKPRQSFIIKSNVH